MPDSVKKYNLLTFTPYDQSGAQQSSDSRITVSLTGNWKMTCGVKPDINTAKISYKEFARLDPVRGPGVIEMWYSSSPQDLAPDVTIEGVWLTAVNPTGFGVPFGEEELQPTEYELYFADARYLFVEPRGGRLRYGLLNAGPKVSGGSQDEDDSDDAAPEFTLTELVQACADKMGSIPGTIVGLDDIEAPRDVRWFGNHAPSELAKLLEIAGCVLCPFCDGDTYDGTFFIDKIQSAGDPDFECDVRLPDIELPNTDIRGTSILYSSFPNQAILTETTGFDPADSDSEWEFVVQNDKNEWVAIDDCPLFNADGGFAQSTRKKFAGVTESLRHTVSSQIYCFIRLKSSKHDPNVSPIQARVFDIDGDSDILLDAKIAVFNSDSGSYENTAGNVLVKVLRVMAGNILFVGSRLMTVTTPTADLFGQFDKRASFTVRYSVGKSEDDPASGDKRPVYYHAGFTRDNGNTIPLDDETIQAALDGQADDDTRIFMRPELRLIEVDDEAINEDALKAAALAAAEQYFQGVDTPPRLIHARGFCAIPLSGLVSEVEWDQDAVLTRARTNDWYTAHRVGSRDHPDESGSGDAGAFPGQSATGPSAVSLGLPGTTPAVVPVADLVPEAVAGSSSELTLYITGLGTRPGSYGIEERKPGAVALTTGTTAVDPAEVIGTGNGLGGIAFNLAEITGFGTGSGWLLKFHDLVRGTYTGTNDAGVRTYQFWAIAPIGCGDIS